MPDFKRFFLLSLLILTTLFAGAPQVRADVRDLRSLAREIRYALSNHGRELSPSERRFVRQDLAMTILTVQRFTGRRANAGRTLVGLATTAQRLLDLTSENELRPQTQRQLERRLTRTAFLLERRLE